MFRPGRDRHAAHPFDRPPGPRRGGAPPVLGAVAWALAAQRDTGAARRLVTEAYAVIDRLDGLLTGLVDAETGQRGFLLTGEEAYLEPYAAALPRIERDLAAVTSLLAEEPTRAERLSELPQLVAARLDSLRRIIETYRSVGAAAAMAIVRTNEGKALMDAIRGVLAGLQAEERALLDERLGRLERQAAAATGALALAGLLALALGGSTGALLLREARAGRRRAERALSEEEAHARAILELNPQVLWTARPDGGIEDFAERWLEWTGLTRGQALGDGWARVPHPDDLPRMIEAWSRSVATGEPYDVEHRIRIVDGSFRWMRSRAVARRDPATGAILRWYGTTEDVHKRRLAEDALRGSEARLRAVLDQMPVGVALAEMPSGHLIYHNPRAVEMLGHPLLEAADVSSYARYGALREDGRPYAPEEYPIARAVRRGEAVDGEEMRYRRSGDGRTVWFAVSAAPVRTEGSAALAVSTFTDVTAAKVAVAGLRAAEARFRALFEALPVAAYVTDPDDLSILDCNEAAAEMLGYAREELRGLPLTAIDAGQSEGQIRDRAGTVPSGRVHRFETRHRTRAGELRDALLSTVPLELDGRRLFYSVVVDVTEQRRAEEALRRALADQRAVYANAPVGLSAHDRDLRFLAVNERIAAINGVPAEDHIGRTPREVIPKAGGFVEPLLRRVLETGEPMPEVEIEAETAAHPGERRFYLASYYPLHAAEEGGEVEGVSVAVLDIDARKRAEAALRDLATTLERRVEERTLALADTVAQLDAFAYTISHDLMAPLRAMDGFAKILLEDHSEALGERGRRYAGRIVGAARRMDDLIQDLLAYSRLSRADVELGWVDLEGVVDAAVADLAAGHARPWPPEVAVERPLPPVRANRAVLAQMVTNLLGNAAKFVAAGERPRLRVRAEERDGGRVRLWVEDDGIGIAPEHQTRIFNVFERLHGQESYPGTGIGLAIVRKGAERMGGAAGVESEGPGRGSRFWVELPLAGRDGGAP